MLKFSDFFPRIKLEIDRGVAISKDRQAVFCKERGLAVRAVLLQFLDIFSFQEDSGSPHLSVSLIAMGLLIILAIVLAVCAT